MSPILRPNTLEIISKSAEQTKRIGMRLGSLLQAGDLICLEGDLGSGKTTFVQGVVAGWGSYDLVTSPTFVLVNVYRRPDKALFFHFDAYRLQNSFEAENLDLDSMLDQGVLIIEWADKVKDILPNEYLWINMRWIAEEQRDLILTVGGKRYINLLGKIRNRVYGIKS